MNALAVCKRKRYAVILRLGSGNGHVAAVCSESKRMQILTSRRDSLYNMKREQERKNAMLNPTS